jgi:type II secretory pathway pseudopilin PulG
MVEILVAMSIAATLTAGVLASYTYLARNLVRNSFQQRLEAQSRRMLQQFAQDVRAATAAAPDSCSTTNQLTFTMPDGSTVQYIYEPIPDPDPDRDPNILPGTCRVRRVAAGTTLILLPGGVSILPAPPTPLYQGFFGCFDKSDALAGSQQAIRKIEIGGFSVTYGRSASGTQSQFIGASARLVLRNKGLSN